MQIDLQNLWKRYNAGWIIKSLDFRIDAGSVYAVVGPNGSGKSTLIQMISGLLSPSKGSIKYSLNGDVIDRDDIHRHIAVGAAYAEMDEELTAEEIFDHIRKFKTMAVDSSSAFLELAALQKEKNKPVSGYSSGMKQRLNLALALTMDVPLLLLDEPSSFLDESKRQWLDEMLVRFGKGKTIIIASNDERDLKICEKRLEMVVL